MKMYYSVKFYQKIHIIPIIIKLWSQKSFFVYKFALPPNTTSPNSNALEWIIWRKMRWLKLDKHVHQGSQAFFNQNSLVFHSHYHYLLPPTKRAANAIKSFRLKLLLGWICTILLLTKKLICNFIQTRNANDIMSYFDIISSKLKSKN